MLNEIKKVVGTLDTGVDDILTKMLENTGFEPRDLTLVKDKSGAQYCKATGEDGSVLMVTTSGAVLTYFKENAFQLAFEVVKGYISTSFVCINNDRNDLIVEEGVWVPSYENYNSELKYYDASSLRFLAEEGLVLEGAQKELGIDNLWYNAISEIEKKAYARPDESYSSIKENISRTLVGQYLNMAVINPMRYFKRDMRKEFFKSRRKPVNAQVVE